MCILQLDCYYWPGYLLVCRIVAFPFAVEWVWPAWQDLPCGCELCVIWETRGEYQWLPYREVKKDLVLYDVVLSLTSPFAL